jgi:hypothetical protein
VRAEVITLREHLVGDVRPAVALFRRAVIAVLLIACVNVTNLLLRAAPRATRSSPCGPRSAPVARRLVGQLLFETLCWLAARRCAALLAHGAMRGLASWGPREVMWIDSLHVDAGRIAFAGCWPSRSTPAGLVPALRPSGIGLQAPGHRT